MNLSLNASQISKLGIAISKYARSNRIRYTKVRQVENGYSVKANLYPFESKFAIRGAVKKYLGVAPKRHKRIRYQKV
ncbi:hypothetical protein QQ020_07030 [Fulvivirgaceae bacterium BMA12]|uniref:Phage protein n=1 Tax=Agaribacillus aureus TaxID=3051825 RepID=A0ABT8L452_9BACT|nr:hypothetical protein [Fulvivirgaceae bacterium BMA12]